MSQTIDQRLLTDLTGIAAGADCELLHVEFVAGTLRIILDHPEGVTLKHCETVSREASELLDTVDYGPERYTLEVSSPGLDRKLYKPTDYERFVGQPLKLSYRDESGAKHTILGRLDGFEPGQRDDGSDGTAKVIEQDRSETLAIPLERILVARLQVEV
jgi:ribosome maturation factor RimP